MSRPCRRWRDARMPRAPALLVLAAMPAIAACMPLVLHEPRVQEGWRIPLSIAAGFLPETLDEDPQALPYATLGYGYGWVGARSALSAGVQVPLFPHTTSLLLAAADLYVQPDRSHAAGAGVLASASMAMPYVQFGVGPEVGSSIFTTQGVAFLFNEYDRSSLWMPTVAFRDERDDGSRAATIHFTAGVPFGGADWVGVLGIVFEFARSRSP